MGSGFRTWTNGEVVTDSNVQNYLQDQVVATFASSAARAAAISSPEEGMYSDLQDVDTLYRYTGAAYVPVASSAAWTTFTTTWTGSTTNPTKGNAVETNGYIQLGKTVFFRISIVLGSTTTIGSGAYGFSLPVAPSAAGTQACSGLIVDDSATSRYACSGFLTNASGVFRLLYGTGSVGVAHNAPFTFAQNDTITIAGSYESV